MFVPLHTIWPVPVIFVELIAGVTGRPVTTTLVLALVGGQPPGIFVTETVYVPLLAAFDAGITGF